MPGVTPATAGSCDASPRAGRRVDRDRHSADRQRPVARHQSGDRSQARRCRRSGLPNTEEARKRAHLAADFPQHPVCRHIAVAVLMALSAMGVQIAPLRAGAGVFGIAVGFGAPTFARDVIAGMFYLLDDAFRVGEYIQAGRYKGTVEGFSIRSVRLRHHRGPVFTVPFNLLGAVENMSRDWVIDKIAIGITYDS